MVPYRWQVPEAVTEDVFAAYAQMDRRERGIKRHDRAVENYQNGCEVSGQKEQDGIHDITVNISSCQDSFYNCCKIIICKDHS